MAFCWHAGEGQEGQGRGGPGFPPSPAHNMIQVRSSINLIVFPQYFVSVWTMDGDGIMRTPIDVDCQTCANTQHSNRIPLCPVVYHGVVCPTDPAGLRDMHRLCLVFAIHRLCLVLVIPQAVPSFGHSTAAHATWPAGGRISQHGVGLTA